MTWESDWTSLVPIEGLRTLPSFGFMTASIIRSFFWFELMALGISYALLVAEVELVFTYIEFLLVGCEVLGVLLFVSALVLALKKDSVWARSSLNIILSGISILLPILFVFVIFSQLK